MVEGVKGIGNEVLFFKRFIINVYYGFIIVCVVVF